MPEIAGVDALTRRGEWAVALPVPCYEGETSHACLGHALILSYCGFNKSSIEAEIVQLADF